jgi:hypothetical protein
MKFSSCGLVIVARYQSVPNIASTAEDASFHVRAGAETTEYWCPFPDHVTGSAAARVGGRTESSTRVMNAECRVIFPSIRSA